MAGTNGVVRRKEKQTPIREPAPDGWMSRDFSITNANQFIQKTQELLSNFEFSRRHWMQNVLNPKGRDLEKECGYPVGPITFKFYMDLYETEGIAARVNDLYPDETWATDPELTNNPDPTITTKLDRAWLDMLDNPSISPWLHLYQVDKLSGIGRYGTQLYGFNDGNDPSKALPGLDKFGKRDRKKNYNHELNFISEFTEDLCQVIQWDNNPNSPRFQQPILYQMTLNEFRDVPTEPGVGVGQSATTTNIVVHWTRVGHFADGRMSSKIYGIPRMRQTVNRLLDCRKILGSSGEMFYKGAWPGYSVEQMPGVPEDMELDEESIRDQMDKYYNQIKRYVAFIGATVKPLTPNIVPPGDHLEQQLRMIAATLGCPLRVFLGSEAAHLASTQDIQTWNKRIAKRQKTYVNPWVITPFVDRMMAAGVLPLSKYTLKWKDLNALSDKDKADVALKKSQALLQYCTSGSEKVMPLIYFLSLILEIPDEVAKVIMSAAKSNKDLLTKELWKQNGAMPGGAGGKDATKKTASGASRNATSKA